MSFPSETVTINSLAYGGDAVGHIDKKVIFVPDAVPGDVVRVRVKEDKNSFLRGEIDTIISPSPHRIEPFCPLSLHCGGCQWQGVAYLEQLRWKKTIVKESLNRISGIKSVTVESCLPSPLDRGYRSIARYPAKVTGKGIVFGYYGRRSHHITAVDECPVACDKINNIAKYMTKLFSNISPDIDIREITIQASLKHPSALVSITTGGNHDLNAMASRMIAEIPRLEGVTYIPGPSHHKRFYGKRSRYEYIGEKLFQITDSSFFQVNIQQTEQLVSLVTEMLDLKTSDVLVDGYGGVGLFSLCAASTDTVIHLYDLSSSAVKDSIHNAKNNGFTAFSAHREETLSAARIIGQADILILNPPRQGLGIETVKAACIFGARTIVYISCNPTTLARDLKSFIDEGYTIERVVPVDMFPHTYHIETVEKLKKT